MAVLRCILAIMCFLLSTNPATGQLICTASGVCTCSNEEKRNLSDIVDDSKAIVQLYAVKCGLQAIDEFGFEPENVTHLDLSHNEINHIATQKFTQIANCKVLSISNNKISSLEDGTFDGMKDLVELDLSHNLLTDLPQGLFCDLQSLASFFLQNNIFSACMDFKSFDCLNNNCNSVSSLSKIDLSNNNLAEVKNISRFHNLNVLSLSGNPHLKLNEAFFADVSKTMTRIELSGVFKNNTELDLMALSHISSIELLDIGNNSFGELSIGKFTGLKQLKFLFLYNNGLSKLDYENLKNVFPQLVAIDVSGNDWACEYLKEMIDWLKSEGISVYFQLKSNEKTEGSTNVEGVECNTIGSTEISIFFDNTVETTTTTKVKETTNYFENPMVLPDLIEIQQFDKPGRKSY